MLPNIPIHRGIEPYDKPDTLYVERQEPESDYTTILVSEDYFDYEWSYEVLFQMARDFEVQENYMFATRKTQNKDGVGTK